MKGITRRWIRNTLGVALFVVSAAVLALSLTVRSAYYNSIENVLVSRAESIRTYINSVSDYYGDFYTLSRNVVSEYGDADTAELMMLDRSGNITISSSGFINTELAPHEDYDEAIVSVSGIGIWTGDLMQTGENVMSVTVAVTDQNGVVVGAVRLMTSLTKMHTAVFAATMTFILIGIVIMAVAVMSGTYFINTIVIPVNEITGTAKKIASGDYNVRVERKYDDEIGELGDTINDLANGLIEADRVKNDFISTVSHELRTPLTAIRGWGDTLLLAADDKEIREKGLKVIVEETDRLSKMVEELLDFSRLQSGRLTMRMGPCDILAEVQEAVLTYEPRAKAEGKSLILNMPDEDMPIINADGNRLRQVFINIIDNAIKYTDEGGVITVGVVNGNGHITVTVQDNGCGIAESDLPRIGEKFYKANFTRRGSGIGLATCDEIIRQHNGMLGIESKEGEGTKVSVALPVN